MQVLAQAGSISVILMAVIALLAFVGHTFCSLRIEAKIIDLSNLYRPYTYHCGLLRLTRNSF